MSKGEDSYWFRLWKEGIGEEKGAGVEEKQEQEHGGE